MTPGGSQSGQRLLALDVFRGATVAGMILVNNPGSWGAIYDGTKGTHGGVHASRNKFLSMIKKLLTAVDDLAGHGRKIPPKV